MSALEPHHHHQFDNRKFTQWLFPALQKNEEQREIDSFHFSRVITCQKITRKLTQKRHVFKHMYKMTCIAAKQFSAPKNALLTVVITPRLGLLGLTKICVCSIQK